MGRLRQSRYRTCEIGTYTSGVSFNLLFSVCTMSTWHHGMCGQTGSGALICTL
jgi:hypothetical protein